MTRPEGFNYLPEAWRAYIAGVEASQESVRSEAQIQAETLAQLLGAAIIRLKELGETSWELPPYARALRSPARMAEQKDVDENELRKGDGNWIFTAPSSPARASDK